MKNLDVKMKVFVVFIFLLRLAESSFVSYTNVSYPTIPGLEIMSPDKFPHFTIIESVSKTQAHRHKRQVIAGPVYEWQSNEIPYQVYFYILKL
jgi:hypothetical protein